MRNPQRAVPLLHDYLLDSAQRLPDKTALVCGADRLTYAELDARSNALAHHIIDAGVQRGDRVVLFADNTPPAVIAFWAALKANAIVSVVNPQTRTDKLHYMLQDCRPAVLVTDQPLYATFAEPARACASLKTTLVCGAIDDEKLSRLPSARRWDDALAGAPAASPPARKCIDIDLAAIIYTSGSTGDPKGAMLTHRNMLAACASVSSYLEVQEDEVILDVLPLAFNYGLYQMIMAFCCGARLVLERSFAFPAQTLRLMVSEEATAFPGVPTIFSTLAEMKSLRDQQFPNVRYVSNTAGPLPEKHIEMLKKLFPRARIYSMYGLTECKRCSYLPPQDLERKPGSVGVAIPNTEMWIVDEHGNRVGPGVVGQLVIRGATVMKGYWEKPEATAEKLRPGPIPGEQVFYTGDYCRMDEDGYLYFVGRMDDIIKSRGEKVPPKEVETALMNIAGVKEAAVIGVPDALLGEAVKAFVVLESGTTLGEKDLQKLCRAALESYMVPKHIVTVPSLPKTDTGKIRKIGLS
jgi:amino acid adenylation domain-containing protein